MVRLSAWATHRHRSIDRGLTVLAFTRISSSAGIDVLDAQRPARCIKHRLRVVPVDRPTERFGPAAATILMFVPARVRCSVA